MIEARILVVEDNPVTRKLVRFALEAKGLEVLEAPDGRTALKLMEASHPPLVLQDIMLPDMDGLDLPRRLRAVSGASAARILAFSGFVSDLDEVQMSGAGFDDILVKPIEPSRLVAIVEAHLPSQHGANDRFGKDRLLVIADDDPLQLKMLRFLDGGGIHDSQPGLAVASSGNESAKGHAADQFDDDQNDDEQNKGSKCPKNSGGKCWTRQAFEPIEHRLPHTSAIRAQRH
jgi:DNA-binding response OmpR family regulator